ncbi:MULTISPECIES: hypothetical protein [Enterobacterales]|jgi:septin family protein|uniref:Uncharacterized protein n=1 Tax=Erwinia tracheiphila TaxID=65700 RepID=A0A345D043_9GAMM|nr:MULTISPECIES: hypothetical protein [Enterobacterales]EDJ7683701.1 hypothetical protein [Salmonella enterica subsp. enterica serovar Kentucky]EGI9512084.1 hypothetical protein [Salmonella enterica]AXF79022.1 hypothetical protein AV903_26535 [Erwinia tracheiphila]AXF79060.1 hypothetical protein AV903_26755 [Erwinia tracheiphila]KAF1366739.1 septin family protein [Yokenella regensburgei]
MNDKIHISAAGNVMVTGESGWGKTCLQSQLISQLMPVLPSQSDVAQLQQRCASEDSETFAETLRKNCNVWIILKSGGEHHGE